MGHGCNATHNCDDMGVDLTGWNVAVGLEQLPCIGKVGPIDWKVFLVTPGQFQVFSFCHLSDFEFQEVASMENSSDNEI
jgi:hypothetical protein